MEAEDRETLFRAVPKRKASNAAARGVEKSKRLRMESIEKYGPRNVVYPKPDLKRRLSKNKFKGEPITLGNFIFFIQTF